MRSVRLFTVVLANLRRSRNHFLLASIGIVVGIATFAFFLSLGLGVRQVVLGKIFPLDKLEVIPRNLDVDVGPLRMGLGKDVIDDAMAARIAALPGVKAVYPKMKLTVGSIAYGGESLFGSDLRSEIVADGIDPDLLAAEINKDGFEFVDFDTPERLAAEPPKACKVDADCGERDETKLYCGLPPGTRIPSDGSESEVAKTTGMVCRHFVPVIVSNHVIELYNGTLRRAHGFPKLNPEAVRGFAFDLIIGESMVAASNKDHVVHDRGMFVGFSDKAIPLGITLPLGYVQRYNVEFGNADDAQRYHSVIVEIPVKDDVAAVAKGVEGLDLQVADSGAEEAALLIAVFMMVFGLVSVVIVGIAAVNIMHVFFMLVYERQREIGVMRAVGASMGDVGRIIIGEAAALGTMAGTLGLLLAMSASVLFDQVSARYVPDFPYKPTTYFVFPWWLVMASLAFAIGFCVLGAALPARRAARMEPARVLSGN
jgi:putative ABC transport system permease protein